MSMLQPLIKELAEEVMEEAWKEQAMYWKEQAEELTKQLEESEKQKAELEKFRRWYYTGEPPKTQYPKPLVAEDEDSDDDEPIQFKKDDDDEPIQFKK